MFGLKPGRVSAIGRIAGSGGRPTLDLNFLGGSADSRITTTRAAGGATYYDQTGTLQLAAANTPRIDYGSIIGSVTNYAFPSTNWLATVAPTGSSVGRTQNAGTAPDGTNTALLLISASGALNQQQFITFPSGAAVSTTYTYSVYLKAAGYNFCGIGLENNAFSPGQVAYFNLSTGTISSQSGNSSATITSAGNGWYRVSVTGTSTATATVYVADIHPSITGADGGVFTGDGISGILAWGNQIEISSTMGVYVPTSSGIAGGGVRTNWIRNSTMVGMVDGSLGTAPIDWEINGVSLGLSRTITAATLNGIAGFIIEVSGTTTGAGSYFINPDLSFTTLATIGQTWTQSGYFALVAGSLGSTTFLISPIITNSAGSGLAVLASVAPTLTSTVTRTSATGTITSPTATYIQPRLRIDFASSGITFDVSIFIGAPQLEQGPTAGPIIPTSGAIATVGATPLGLLVEETRTNSITNPRCEGAVVGTPGTLPTNWSFGNVNGLTQQIVAIGSESGIPFIDLRLSGTATGAQVVLFTESLTLITAASGQTWTSSAYVRLVSGSLANIISTEIDVSGRASGGGTSGDLNGVTITPTNAALVSQRRAYTLLLAQPTTVTVVQRIAINNNAIGDAIDLTLRIGAPQLELGATMSSPILPAVGTPATTTRAQDVSIATVTSIDSPARSLAIEAFKFAQTGPENSFAMNSTNNAQTIRSFFRINGVEPAIALEGTATGTVDQGGSNIAKVFKLAASYPGASVAASLNGAAPNTGAVTGTMETAWNRVALGCDTAGNVGWNGYVRRFRYWPRAMTNAELMRTST